MLAPESQKPRQRVSASAMLTGKFLQIRKVFATSSLLAEELRDSAYALYWRQAE